MRARHEGDVNRKIFSLIGERGKDIVCSSFLLECERRIDKGKSEAVDQSYAQVVS
jgi:hypothetical protein